MDWFIGLIHWTDSLDWFIGLIHWMDWFIGLIHWTDSLDWFIRWTDSLDWFIGLIHQHTSHLELHALGQQGLKGRAYRLLFSWVNLDLTDGHLRWDSKSICSECFVNNKEPTGCCLAGLNLNWRMAPAMRQQSAWSEFYVDNTRPMGYH